MSKKRSSTTRRRTAKPPARGLTKQEANELYDRAVHVQQEEARKARATVLLLGAQAAMAVYWGRVHEEHMRALDILGEINAWANGGEPGEYMRRYADRGFADAAFVFDIPIFQEAIEQILALATGARSEGVVAAAHRLYRAITASSYSTDEECSEFNMRMTTAFDHALGLFDALETVREAAV